ncbi:hypothetical protein RUND412_008831 [Rhizina undulata]
MATNPNVSETVVDGDAATLEKISESLEGVETGIGDVDESRLAEMGYKAELNRKFSLLSCLAVGFSISNSWFGVTGALSTGIANGGAAVYVYGAILVALVHVAIGASLGELASAYPNAGGQYFWVISLAPKNCRRFLSYLTGVVAWAGAMITGASVSLVIGQSVVALIVLAKPEIVYQPWMGFVGYQIANFLIFVFNCFERILPALSTGSLYFSIMSFVVITITVLAVSPTKRSSKEVWATLTNDSGWSNNGVSFITGLLGINWGFSCLDACTHMAEEIPNPERNVPKAILGTVGIGFLTSWVYIIAIFYSLQDLQEVASALVPSLELYRQALRGSVAGAIVLQVLVIVTGAGCLMSVHTWESRLLWSFSRDNGFPFSKWLSKVAEEPYKVPLWAHTFSCFWIAVLGCLYLASSTAFNSLVTGCILMQYISYIIPVILLMLKGRKIRHGPFWLGTWGWLANGVLVAWVTVTMVFYSFPYVMPVKGSNMNYVTVVMAVIFIYLIVYWFWEGKRTFTGVKRADGEEEIEK